MMISTIKLVIFTITVRYAVLFSTASPLFSPHKVGMSDKANQTMKNMSEEGNLSDDGYPIVYTMDIPTELAKQSTFKNFAVQFDLLSAEILQENGSIRLSFLVHSKDEYDLMLGQTSFDMVKDLEETLTLHRFARIPDNSGHQPDDTISGFPCYRNLDGMTALMNELEMKASAIDSLDVHVIDIGDSYEKTFNPKNGYDMLALKITGNGVAAKGWKTNKGIVFITCGIHAREYSPPELCARWAESLVEGYSTGNTEIISALDHTEVHMIIESNPDGRLIAETDRSRYHRKNTRPQCFRSYGIGVDLNRNFPFQWGLDSGSSDSECSATYRGRGPASEPEVQAIVRYAESVFPASQRKDDPMLEIDDPYPEDSTVGVYYDIHSYSDLILWPWSYENRVTGNEESLQAGARKLKSYNSYSLSGPGQPDFLYPASAASFDYFYGELGAFSFAYELGTAFYQDCERFEDIIVPDNLPGFLYTAKISTRPYSLVKGPDITNFSLPSTIYYETKTDLSVNVTVSDSELSSGPGNHSSSTQNIASISLCFDMHPYDIDSEGNGPQTMTVSINIGKMTVTDVVSVPLSSLSSTTNVLLNEQQPLIGNHTVYLWGTDSDGSIGPVTAVPFTITQSSSAPTVAPTTFAPTVTCDVDSDFRVNGNNRKDCTWIMKRGTDSGRIKKMCARADVVEACPSACGICCADNTYFTFKTGSGKVKDCAWIAKRPNKRLDRCEKNKVKAACQLTCVNCTPP